jgi:ComF family protein
VKGQRGIERRRLDEDVIEAICGHGRVSILSAMALIEPHHVGLPTQCAVCRGWSARRVCADCVARHAAPRARCRGCAMPLAGSAELCGACITAPLPFERVVAAVDYGFPWSSLVSALKFNAALDRADAMAALLADAVRRSGGAMPTPVTPVPLGAERLSERGMNQAWELARRVAARLSLKADARLLQRRVETPHLADLPRDARAKAIRGAFALAPGASSRVHGRSLVLVDDVMTTGATAAEAARVLLAAGATTVALWVFARTP